MRRTVGMHAPNKLSRNVASAEAKAYIHDDGLRRTVARSRVVELETNDSPLRCAVVNNSRRLLYVFNVSDALSD